MNAAGVEAVGGVGTNSGIDGLTMAGNHIETTNWGIGIWGGEDFSAGAVQGGYVRHLDIRNNTIVGAPGNQSQCLVLEAGRADGSGAVTSSDITHAHLVGNHVSNCGVSGITIHAGFSGDAGVATGNAASDIEIARNDITHTASGLVIRGGMTSSGFSQVNVVPGSLTQGNISSGILVRGNRLINNAESIRLVGGEVQAPVGISTANQVGPVSFTNNIVTGGRCNAAADAGTGATGNVLLAACPS